MGRYQIKMGKKGSDLHVDVFEIGHGAFQDVYLGIDVSADLLDD